jgi:hypothetical protein
MLHLAMQRALSFQRTSAEVFYVVEVEFIKLGK